MKVSVAVVPAAPSATLGELIETVGSLSDGPVGPSPPSSSSRVRLAPVTCPIPCVLLAEPVTLTLRSASPVSLSTALIVAVSEAFAVSPAAMVIVPSEPTV